MLHSPENFGFTILFSFDAPASHLLKISDLLPSSKSVNPINSFELSSPELDCIPPASRPEYFSYSTYEIPSDALQMLLKI